MNENLLNINQIISNKYGNKLVDVNNDIENLNSVVQNNVNNRYKIIKYLGEGIHGSLYLVKDMKPLPETSQKNINNDNNNDTNNDNNNDNRIILKRINLPGSNPKLMKQLNLELNILKFLSNSITTNEYINPCINYKILDNQILILFPVFNGYSLKYLLSHLKKLKNVEYYKIILHLIKKILHGLANIHKMKIAHQNITENSILVSTYIKPNEIKIKFTDFGLGCNSNPKPSNIVNITDYEKHMNNHNKNNHKNNNNVEEYKCSVNINTPLEISQELIDKLTDADYLLISQKYDLWCLGVIFLKLLLRFEKLDGSESGKWGIKKGYNKTFETEIRNKIIKKYLVNTEGDNQTRDLMFSGISETMKKDIIEYLKILNKYVIKPTPFRHTCQYVLDKIIVYEKYKNDNI
jgi:serine/threonine protein kinase